MKRPVWRGVLIVAAATLVVGLALAAYLAVYDQGGSRELAVLESLLDKPESVAFRERLAEHATEGPGGRELECSVLGNDDPIASVPGEVIPTHDL